MSIECGECEHDLRGGHHPSCSSYKPCVCPVCAGFLSDGDGYLWCPKHGEVEPLTDPVAVERLRAALTTTSAPASRVCEDGQWVDDTVDRMFAADAAVKAVVTEQAKVALRFGLLKEYYEAAEAFAEEKTTGNGTRLVRARKALKGN